VEEMERTSLIRVRTSSPDSPKASQSSAVAVVDPFSTGAVLAFELSQLGYKVYAGRLHSARFQFSLVVHYGLCSLVYSSNLDQLSNLQNLVPQGLSLSFDKVIPFDPNITALAAKLTDSPLGE